MAVLWLLVLIVLLVCGLSREGTGTTAHGATKQTANRDAGVDPTAQAAATRSSQCAIMSLSRGKRPARLAPHGAVLDVLAFSRDTDERTRSMEYDVTDPSGALAGARCLHVEVGEFLNDSKDAQLTPGRLTAVVALGPPGRATLSVTADRSEGDLGRPGSYTGLVEVIDPRVARTDVALRVTMSYPNWQLPLAVLIAMMAPGAIYVWLVKGSFTSRASAPGATLHLKEADAYWFSRNGLLAVGAGTAAAVGFFSATYLSSATWGANVEQWVTLFGGSFTAFTAAATAVSAAGSETPPA